MMTLAKSIAMTKLPVRNDYLASYFSAAPNNLFCGLIYGLALKAAMLLGFRNSDLCLAIINVLFVNCAAALMYNSAKKIIHQKCAIISVLVFYLLFGFSHHIVTPYTDSLGMVVVMLLIVVYIKIRESAKRGKIVFSLLFAVLSALGFLVKPQVLITSIAVLICDIFFDYKKNKYRIYFALALIAAIVYVPVNFYTRNNLIEGMDFSKERKIELFLLYGVCERDGTYGVWDGESYELYKSFTDEAERRSACLQRIGEKKKIWGHLVFRLSYTKSSVSHSATERFLLEEKAEESGCC
ncbi:MAG: glycosyltransferase family 39 protein [Acidaminococcaceae bacterium]|nr:glycosyltransferase family 39 protein [Acidaminococcaceae bacterium]